MTDNEIETTKGHKLLTTNGHEWTRMFMTSPLNTRKERNASQTSAIVLMSLLTICDFYQGGIGRASVCSAVRHALRGGKGCRAEA